MSALTARDVRAVRFNATKFREGYDVDEVDAMLERVAASLDDLTAARGGPQTVTAEEVLNAKFQATKFRDGYDQDQVDDFLDAAILSLKAAHAAAEAARRAELDPAAVAAEARAGASRIRAARVGLVPVRRARGYSVAEVDELLGRLTLELDRRARGGLPRTTGHDVRTARPGRTWWNPGYPRSVVDGLLGEVAAALGG